MSGEWLRSGEVAAAAGVNAQTLRYYHRRGLIEEPLRSLGGHRRYPPRTVAVLRTIKAAQRLGFTLDEVGDLIEAGAMRDRAVAKLDEIERRIADLQAVRATLRAAVEAGCDDLAVCAATASCPLPLG